MKGKLTGSLAIGQWLMANGQFLMAAGRWPLALHCPLPTSHFQLHFIFILVFLLTVPSPSNAQNHSSQSLSDYQVSLRVKNKTLSHTLEELSEASGFYFTYDSRLFNPDTLLSINFDNIALSSAIDSIFSGASIQWEIINNNIVLFPEQPASPLRLIPKQQNELKLLCVSGKLLDDKKQKPLPFGTVSIKDSYFGTITNNDGYFEIRFPDTIANPILISSYLGYRNKYTPISANTCDTLRIELSKNYISLQEVVIRYKDPIQLLSESLERKKENYEDEASGMTAYYREKVRKDEHCMLFSEAVLDIAKAPYTNSFRSERSKLLKARKVTNVDLNDTIVLKISSGISSMLQLDIMHSMPDFLEEGYEARYDFSYSDVEAYKDKLVYVISFKQKEFINDLLFRGQLYLDMQNLAIIAADFSYDPMKIRSEPGIFISRKSRHLKLRPLSASYHVEYSQHEGKYHLSIVQGEVEFKVRKRRTWLSSRYKINLDMAVTNVRPGDPPKIKMGEQLKPTTVMADEIFSYDAEFWGDFNIISPENTLHESLKHIEKAMLEVVED